MILGCLINLIILVIIAVIILYILEVALQPFMALPAPVYTLIRLLIGLLILLQFLNCIGFLGTYGGYHSEPFIR
jgi:hypothetical protein